VEIKLKMHYRLLLCIVEGFFVYFLTLPFLLKIRKEKYLSDGENHRTSYCCCLQLSGRKKRGKVVLDNL